MNRSLPAFFLLLTILTVLAFPSCKSGDKKEGPKKGSTEQNVPEALVPLFREDAAKLTAREVQTSTTSRQLEADLPKDRIDYYYGVLEKAYLIYSKRNNIPDLSDIRARGPNVGGVSVILEKNSPFKGPWSKGDSLTGNLHLNQLIARYKLSVENYGESFIGPSLTLQSAGFINGKALAEMLTKIDGIKVAEEFMLIGDGDDIHWGPDGKNKMSLKFSRGEGDCPSGCIHRKYWIFQVGQEGEIVFMGTQGNLPSK